jgi:hypothetical protein
MTIKLKGENRLNYISGDVTTIDDAGGGNGTLIVINGDTPLSGDFIINSGTVKAKATTMVPAVGGVLTVNGGAVYLAGGWGSKAVGSGIEDEATLYGWDGGSWQDGVLIYQSQYITTDDNSGDPTTDWNW